MPLIDLHTHSTFSDGVLTPAQLVARASRVGVGVLALADHDTIDGIREAQRAARRLDIKLIPAIETTVKFESYNVHVLGLNINPHHRALARLLSLQRKRRIKRARRMVARLKQASFAVSWHDVRANSRLTVGRPNVARAVLKRQENSARLKREFGKQPSFHEFIKHYIIPGTPGYVEAPRPTVRQAISVIRQARGIAVLAHPLGLTDDAKMVGHLANPWPVIGRLLAHDFDGVELFYRGATPANNRKLLNIARRRTLCITGGSDFHDPKTSPELGHYTKSQRIPQSVMAALKLDIPAP